MSLNDDRTALKRNGWRRLRWVTVTAAIVFAALVMLDALAIGYALAAFAMIRRPRFSPCAAARKPVLWRGPLPYPNAPAICSKPS